MSVYFRLHYLHTAHYLTNDEYYYWHAINIENITFILNNIHTHYITLFLPSFIFIISRLLFIIHKIFIDYLKIVSFGFSAWCRTEIFSLYLDIDYRFIIYMIIIKIQYPKPVPPIHILLLYLTEDIERHIQPAWAHIVPLPSPPPPAYRSRRSPKMSGQVRSSPLKLGGGGGTWECL